MDLSHNEEDGEVKIHHKKDFHHPYTPYPIQETFMQTVYDVLEQGKIGILESPTGTGKSLSLICGSLTWLRDFKKREFEGQLGDGLVGGGEPDWVLDMARKRRMRELLEKREEMQERLRRVREKERWERERMGRMGGMGWKGDARDGKRRKVGGDGDAVIVGDGGGDENEFLLDDWDSDGEGGSSGREKTGDEAIFSKETLELRESIGIRSKKVEDEEELDDEMKIFYCSRTHSQLTQFINELRRVEFPSSIPLEESPSKSKDKDKDKDNLHEPLKHLTLGSRKNLCINPKVNKLASVTAINERCAELQQSSTPKEHKCPHLPNKDNKPLVTTFRDHALATIRDIEDMGALGKEISICPYYASRSAIKPAEIVTLPYPLLLQKSARDSLGINLKGHVVIVDEAHNIMDAIAEVYGSKMSLRELRLGREMLGNYLKKFAKKLKGKNRVYVTQVVRVVDSLAAYLDKRLNGKEDDGVVDEKELLAGKGADQINLFKLIRYLQESKLARKVESYTTHVLTTATPLQPHSSSYNVNPTPKPSTTPILHTLTSLLLALTHPKSEGQLFFTKQPPPSPDLITLKFQLLDPASHFESIVRSARAVILAGGTMSPFSDYTSILFPSIPPHKITTLSCGHVVPKSNIFASVIDKGPRDINFKWTFDNRMNTTMLDELGSVLLNICTVVPGGIVVFFPSYNVLDSILRHFDQNSHAAAASTSTTQPSSSSSSSTLTVLERIARKKQIFKEEKSESVDTILRNYARAVDNGKGGEHGTEKGNGNEKTNGNGAILFSVVGGKLSEGINFSDDLGRCVIIVGLPFANAQTAEWKRRLRFIEEGAVRRLTSLSHSENEKEKEKEGENNERHDEMMIQRKAKQEAREFLENNCMRAVNQCVGRAIRHRGDWAAILLLDQRYKGVRIQEKLAGWIREVVRGEGEGRAEGRAEEQKYRFAGLVGSCGGFCRGRGNVS
ncbi:ATP-dependent DNA helicase chl1 [Ciborinia camelliae]|nr:ATP-dependent DNA helicase chl1 [Ciborinia camelliae]